MILGIQLNNSMLDKEERRRNGWMNERTDSNMVFICPSLTHPTRCGRKSCPPFLVVELVDPPGVWAKTLADRPSV